MEAPLTFEAKLLSAGPHGGVYVEVPEGITATFNTKGQIKVKAVIDGIPYRGSMANMGGGCYALGILKTIYQTLGKTVGDSVIIQVEKDLEERVVQIPQVLQEILDAHPIARQFFESLSYTNKKEYALWLTNAKREETRQKRMHQTLEKLLAGKKNPSE